jgi:hypothetical protein
VGSLLHAVVQANGDRRLSTRVTRFERRALRHERRLPSSSISNLDGIFETEFSIEGTGNSLVRVGERTQACLWLVIERRNETEPTCSLSIRIVHFSSELAVWDVVAGSFFECDPHGDRGASAKLKRPLSQVGVWEVGWSAVASHQRLSPVTACTG